MTASLYISDSGTPILNRIANLIGDGIAQGVILSPFTCPLVEDFNTRAARARQAARRCVQEIEGYGGVVFLDSQTYALDFPGANVFGRYDGWEFWSGQRGDLHDEGARRSHVRRVLARQAEIGVRSLGPTVSLEQPVGPSAGIARDLARMTMVEDDAAWLTLVGAPGFWCEGHNLDAHVGALAQMRPAGVIIAVARQVVAYPAQGLTAEEIQGLCRTVRSLVNRCPVIISHGDLAALPAVAAGCSGLGTGWDLRQRVLGAEAFRASTTKRRRGSRISHGGLLAVLKRREAERLRVVDPARSIRLVPGPLPTGIVPEYMHHLRMLGTAVEAISSAPVGQPRAELLRGFYADADQEFQAVEGLVRPLAFGRGDWLAPVSGGLARYMAAEGW